MGPPRPEDGPGGPLRTTRRDAEACVVGILGVLAIAWSLVPLVFVTAATALAPHLRDHE